MNNLTDKIKKQAVNAMIKSQEIKSDYIEANNSQNKNVKKAKSGLILIAIGIALVILSIFLFK